MSDQPTAPALDQKKLTAIILAGVAAVLMVLPTFSHRWLHNQQVDAGFGLLSFGACAGGECESMSNAKVVDLAREEAMQESDKPSALFVPMGWATLIATYLTVAALLACAGLVLARGSIPRLPLSPPTAALLLAFTTLVTACIFVASNPAKRLVSINWPFAVFGLGNVLTIVSSQMLNKYKPRDPFWDAIDPAIGGPPDLS